jgi:hypothetical protein
MNLQEAATVAALALPALGLAATWGSLNNRMRVLEAQLAKVDALGTKITEVDSRTRDSAQSQGERIGKAQADVDRLGGKFEGFEKGFASGRRSRTAAHGHAIGEKA